MLSIGHEGIVCPQADMDLIWPIQEHATGFLTLYALAGSFAVSALIEKVWFKWDYANIPHPRDPRRLAPQLEHSPDRVGAARGPTSGTVSPVGLGTNGPLSTPIGTSPPPLLQSS